MKIQGLSKAQVKKLRGLYGTNAISAKRDLIWLVILWEQCVNPLIYILLAVGLVSFFLGEYIQLILVMAVVVLNVAMGFFQEYSAQNAVEALKRIIEPKALVIRDGQRSVLDSRELVPGDMIILGTGDKVPADARIVECFNLLLDEAILTGESVGVIKDCQEQNQLFAGTTILTGRAIAQVEKIGSETEIGKIGKSLAEIDGTPTPLQIELNKFSHNLVYLILGISAIIFILALLLKMGPLPSLQLAVVLAVAAIPEGLPVAITLILALGTRRILKKNGLIKRLLSVETLGVTSVICTDKTGTLTEGKMKVTQARFVNSEQARLCLILNNDRRNSLELALWHYAGTLNSMSPEEIFEAIPRIDEVSFDSDKKYMLTAHVIDNRECSFAKGAPEAILPICDLSADQKAEIKAEMEEYAKNGLMVLALATKDNRDLRILNNYQWLGLVAMEDPLRPDAETALRAAREMGIEIKIVTGDLLETAITVARKVGLDIAKEKCLEYSDIEKMNDQELSQAVKTAVIFARITPLQELRIVSAIQSNGHIVAMTGDGVNDAPALKKADIGVVMASGTEVAKEAGDLILLNNGIKTIVAACEEGRTILQNIKKVVGYTLSNSFAEIVLILCAMAMRLPLSLTILQILWLHFLCDGPIDLLLGFEPMEKSVKKVNPRLLAKEEILSHSMRFIIAGISLITGLLAFGGYFWVYNNFGDIVWARTLAFAVLAVPDLIFVFSFKSLQTPLIKLDNFLKNYWLIIIAVADFLLILIALYVPAIAKTLETHHLGISEWLYIGVVTLIDVLFIEGVKYFVNKKRAVLVI